MDRGACANSPTVSTISLGAASAASPTNPGAVRAVIFDVDGTLINSNEAHVQTWVEVFRHFGFERDAAAIRPQMGKGGDNLMPLFLSSEEIDRFGEKMEKLRKELFTKQHLPYLRPFPQVRALFERLAADGKELVLASSASEKEVQNYAKLARIDDLIAGATSRDDVERSKPHPDIFAAALKTLDGIAAKHAIVVGDSPFDAEAASQLNVRTVGLLCGGFPEEELRKAGCVAIYKDPADLLAQYDESPLAQ